MTNSLQVFYLKGIKSAVEKYAQDLLEAHPELGVIAVWNPVIDGCSLKGSAPGIPVNTLELLAQLCLTNIFRSSAMIMRQELYEKYQSTASIGKIDDHHFWFSLVRKGQLALLIVPDSQHFGEVDENKIPSSNRIEFIRQFCYEDTNAIEVIERALSLEPNDTKLSDFYFGYLQNIKQENISQARLEAVQYLRCVGVGNQRVDALNELANYYHKKEKPFLSALTQLYSLSLQPDQSDIYRKFRQNWFDGLFNPSIPKLDPINQTTVSVLLCTYNRPERLKQALESVLSQIWDDYEVLVINDGGDHSAEFVVEQLHSEKIRYYYRKHGGHRAALNFGLQMARGKYIAYLDDDDVYYPTHLETLINAAESDSLDFVCSRNRWVQGHWDGNEWVEDYELDNKDNGFQIERMRISAYVPDNTILHRRSIVEKVGLFWEEPQRGGEWEYWVRCSRYYPIKRIDTVTCECRVLTASLPLTQPARARFFTELWRTYFGSEFGSAILALGAYYAADQISWKTAVDALAQNYVYLRPDIYEHLWTILIQSDTFTRDNLLVKMAKREPVAFSQLIFKYRNLMMENFSHIPLNAYLYILKCAVSHPFYSVKRLFKLAIE